MYELKFYNHGEGKCQGCGVSEQLYKAVVSSGEKSKNYILCKKCCLNLKEQVEKKNALIREKAVNSASTVASTGYKQKAVLNDTGVNSGNSVVYNSYEYSQANNTNTYCDNNDDQRLIEKYGTEKFSKYKKMGGWLEFFCIVQFLTIIKIIGNFQPWSDESINLFDILYAIVIVTLCIMVFHFCRHKNPLFMKLFEAEEIIGVLVATVTIISIFNSSLLVDDASSALGSAIGALGHYIVWLCYFCKSERCEVFFGNREYLRSGILSKLCYKSLCKKQRSR